MASCVQVSWRSLVVWSLEGLLACLFALLCLMIFSFIWSRGGWEGGLIYPFPKVMVE